MKGTAPRSCFEMESQISSVLLSEVSLRKLIVVLVLNADARRGRFFAVFLEGHYPAAQGRPFACHFKG